jgi:hypothetical protein
LAQEIYIPSAAPPPVQTLRQAEDSGVPNLFGGFAGQAHKRLGPGAAIAAMIAAEGIGALDGPIVRVAARNVPLPYSPELENYVLPQTQDLVEATRRLARYSL